MQNQDVVRRTGAATESRPYKLSKLLLLWDFHITGKERMSAKAYGKTLRLRIYHS
jgi:hypothetical protein